MNKFCNFRCAKLLSVFLTPLFLLLCFSTANAQTKRYEISGKVIDASTKEAIPGAGIKIQNTKFAVASSNAGGFSLNVDLTPGSYQIVFSYIGYKSVVKTVTLGNASAVVVNGELSDDAMGLDEIIVTGTSQGTTRKQLGSYVSSVKGDDLLKSPSGNVLSGLQGKTPGAQISQNSGDPAGGMSVRLRGIS